MLDEKFCIEGIFPHVFHARIIDNQHLFLTHNDGSYIARTPMDMFKDDYIENDLVKIISIYEDFYGKPTKIEPTKPTSEVEKVQETTQIDLLNFLLEHANVSQNKITEVCQKYKVTDIKDLPSEIVTKWIAKLQNSVDMRND